MREQDLLGHLLIGAVERLDRAGGESSLSDTSRTTLQILDSIELAQEKTEKRVAGLLTPLGLGSWHPAIARILSSLAYGTEYTMYPFCAWASCPFASGQYWVPPGTVEEDTSSKVLQAPLVSDVCVCGLGGRLGPLRVHLVSLLCLG
jgi:hypothetical protein